MISLNVNIASLDRVFLIVFAYPRSRISQAKIVGRSNMGFQIVPEGLYRLLPNAVTLVTSFATVLFCVAGTALYRRYKVSKLNQKQFYNKLQDYL